MRQKNIKQNHEKYHIFTASRNFTAVSNFAAGSNFWHITQVKGAILLQNAPFDLIEKCKTIEIPHF